MSDNEPNFVDALVKDPSNPPKVRLITGYAGKSATEGMTRIYSNPELSAHIDVATEAVLHSQPVPNDPLGAKYFWIQRDADVTRRDGGPVEVRAKFLSGQITAGAAEAGPAAVPPIGPAPVAPAPGVPGGAPIGQPSVIIECPTVSFNPNLCQSNIGLCQSLDICQSNICISQIPVGCVNTQIPVFCPTRADGDCFTRVGQQCVTWTTPCLTHNFLCRTRAVNCVTRLPACPTVHVQLCPIRTVATPDCINVSAQICQSRAICPTQGICPSAVDACPSALACNTIDFTFNPLM